VKRKELESIIDPQLVFPSQGEFLIVLLISWVTQLSNLFLVMLGRVHETMS